MKQKPFYYLLLKNNKTAGLQQIKLLKNDRNGNFFFYALT